MTPQQKYYYKNKKTILEKRRNYKERRKELGICYNCSGTIVEGRTRCSKCLSLKKEKYKNKVSICKAESLCQHCQGPRPAFEGMSVCERCWFKMISLKAFGTKRRWTELKDLLHKSPICPYTGRLLHPGGASLDHITPKSKGGSNNTDNLRFVYYGKDMDVNMMKHFLTDEEYKESIKVQYEYIFKKEIS